jgi:hypothetical protein
LLAGCGLGTDAPPPEVISAELTDPAPLVRTLRLEVARPAPVTVEYWAEDTPRLRVHGSAATEHSLVLTQLRPGRVYQYQVSRTATAGTFVTAPLPDDLARVTYVTTGQQSIPLVMLHLFDPNGFRGYAAIDGVGEVVWYWRTEDFPFGMTRRENGNFVVLDKARGLIEVTPTGQVMHELAQDLASRELHHDVIATPQNTLLVVAFDDRLVNGTRVRGDAIWEWTPETGSAVKRWTAWDHFDFAANPPLRSLSSEWLHINALAIGPRQNVVVSAFLWNQVFSISSDWQQIEWRLGGVNATIAVAEAQRFSGQHTAREIAPGRIVLFDNGVDRGGYSRVVELATEGSVARTVWEWRAQPSNFASAVSSARRLGGGGTLVGYGMSAGVAGSTGPIEVYEIAADGTQRYRLVVQNSQIMFRAEPLESIAGEELVP